MFLGIGATLKMITTEPVPAKDIFLLPAQIYRILFLSQSDLKLYQFSTVLFPISFMIAMREFTELSFILICD